MPRSKWMRSRGIPGGDEYIFPGRFNGSYPTDVLLPDSSLGKLERNGTHFHYRSCDSIWRVSHFGDVALLQGPVEDISSPWHD